MIGIKRPRRYIPGLSDDDDDDEQDNDRDDDYIPESMDIAGKVDNALHLVLEYSWIVKDVEESPTPKAPLSVSPLQNRIKVPNKMMIMIKGWFIYT